MAISIRHQKVPALRYGVDDSELMLVHRGQPPKMAISISHQKWPVLRYGIGDSELILVHRGQPPK